MTDKVTQRVQKFVDEWAKMQTRRGNSYDDRIYGLHFGTDREAELLASDIRTILAGNTELVEALRVARHYAALFNRDTDTAWAAAKEQIDKALSLYGDER